MKSKIIWLVLPLFYCSCFSARTILVDEKWVADDEQYERTEDLRPQLLQRASALYFKKDSLQQFGEPYRANYLESDYHQSYPITYTGKKATLSDPNGNLILVVKKYKAGHITLGYTDKQRHNEKRMLYLKRLP